MRLAKYRGRQFAGAIADFEAVLVARPQNRPAEPMRDRCRDLLRMRPDESWQPIAALASK